MKPDNPNDQDAPLSGLLQQWQVKASLPPRFQERVWERIAREQPAPRATSAFAQAWARLQSILARPGLAAGYVTALLVLGFGFGWARGLEKSARMDQALSARYVQTVDPYLTSAR